MKQRLEWLIVIIISLFLVFLNQQQVLREWNNNLPGHTYTAIAHYYQDYFLYTEQIRQGQAGHILYTHKYTNEVQSPTWIHWVHQLIGLVSAPTDLSPFAVYNIALACFVFFYLLFLNVVGIVLFKKPSLAFLFFFFASTATNYPDIPLLFTKGVYSYIGYFWYAPTIALNRLGGVPHHNIQSIVFIALPLLFIYSIQQKFRWKTMILLCALSFIATSLNPIQSLVFGMTAAIFTGIEIIKKKHFMILPTLALIACGIGTIPVGIASLLSFQTGSFASARIWELSQQVRITPWQYIIAVGPILFFILFSFSRWQTILSNPYKRIIILYGTLSLLLFFSPIPELIGTLNVRYVHQAPYIFLSLLSVEGIIYLLKKKPLGNILVMILLFFYTILSLLTLIAQMKARSEDTMLSSNLNHVPNTIVSLLTSVKNNENNNQPVLITDPTLPYDTIVPVFSGKISFTGHILHTLYYKAKEELRNRLVSGEMDSLTMQQFFRDHRIGFMLVAPEHESLFDGLPFLDKVAKNEAGAVYKVK